MPRSALGFLETRNITAKQDTWRVLCKPHKHSKGCENPGAVKSPGVVSREAGCEAKKYWRARTTIGLGNGSKPLEAVSTTKGAAENLLRKKIESFRADYGVVTKTAAPLAAGTVGVTVAEQVMDWFDSLKVASAPVTDETIPSLEQKVLSPPTLELYGRVAGIICDDEEISGIDVGIIRPSQLQKFLNERVAYFDADDELWRGTSYLKNAHRILSKSFSKAIADDILTKVSPMEHVEIPRLPAARAKQAAKPMTVAQYQLLRTQFLKQPRYSPYLLPLFDVMAGCGVRIGEALALTRGDLNLMFGSKPLVRFSGHIITVKGASGKTHLTRVSGLKESKESNDFREVFVPPFVQAALTAQLLRVRSKADSALIFQTRSDTIIGASNVRRTLRGLATNASIPQNVSPHSFRKMLAEAINTATDDGGESAASAMGNTVAVANKHYLSRPIRRTTPEIAEITRDVFAQIGFESNYPAG